MSIMRKSRAKCGPGEIRVGNFFVKEESGHIKVRDLNDVSSHRVLLSIPKGQMLKSLLVAARNGESQAKNFLHSYAVVMYNLLSCVPDDQFLLGINELAVECMNRHKELYGIKDDIAKSDDDAILEEEKELAEATADAEKEINGE